MLENIDKMPEGKYIEGMRRIPPKTYLLVRFVKPSYLSFLRKKESMFFKYFWMPVFTGMTFPCRFQVYMK